MLGVRNEQTWYVASVVLVFDKAPFHSNVESDLLTDILRDCKLLRLSPYSPVLNPIEHVWSVIKSEVKKNLAKEMESILNANRGQMSIREHRLRALEVVVQQSVELITPVLCNSCIANIQGRVSGALALEDIQL